MKDKPSICFISEKWVDADPNLPRSTNLTNLHSTARQCGLFNSVSNLYVDELYYKYNGRQTIDHTLLQLNNDNRLDDIDIIFITHLGNASINPSPSIVESIKKNKKIIYSWPDTVWPWIDNEINKTKGYSDLHIAHDFVPDRVVDLAKPTPIVSLGLSQDETIFFYNDYDKKPIDVCFIGTQYGERKAALDYIKANCGDLNIYISEGARVDKLSFEEYGKVLRDSKICINFSRSPVGVDQIKCRIFEATACNTLLLDTANTQTPKFYIENIHYKTFSNEKDAVESIHLLVKNENLRKAIAQAGYEHYISNYSPKVFWTNVLNRLS